VAGVVFTYVFCTDLNRVSSAEHDAQLELFLEGRPESYKGKLNAKEHLSNWELWTGRHGQYDPHWAGKLVESEKTNFERSFGVNSKSVISGGMGLAEE